MSTFRLGFLFSIVLLFLFSCKAKELEVPSIPDANSPRVVTGCDEILIGIIPCDAPQNDTAKDGFIKFYHPNGTLKGEGSIQNGYYIGFWKEYLSDGTPVYEGNYTNRKVDGFRKDFYSNGFEKSSGHYKNCLKDGFWKIYSQSTGEVSSEGNYVLGSLNGVWKFLAEMES